MISGKGVKHWKSTTVGGIMFLLGIGGFVDCWIEFHGVCGLEAKSYVGFAFVLALMFLFLDEDQIKANIQKMFDWALSKLGIGGK